MTSHETINIRAAEIARRRHIFRLVSPMERRGKRKRIIEAALIIIGLAAFGTAGYGILSHPTPQPITAENAPIVLERKSKPITPGRVQQGATRPSKNHANRRS